MKNSCSPLSQSGDGWKGRRTMEEKICEKDEFWAWSAWKRGVMDGDSGDEGNDELACVRSVYALFNEY